MKARYLIYLLSGLMTFYSCVDDKGSYVTNIHQIGSRKNRQDKLLL